MKKKVIVLITSIVLVTMNIGFSVSAKEVQNIGGTKEVDKVSYEADVNPSNKLNILDLNPKEEVVAKNNCVYVDVTLDNINESNNEFQITSVKDIKKQTIVIKYDPNKLQYYGCCGVSSNFMLYGTDYDEESGIISFIINSRNIPEKYNNSVVTLIFNAIEEGEAEVSIKSGTIYNSQTGYDLSETQKGKCNIKITE